MAIFGVFINEILLATDKKNAFASLLARRIVLQWKSPDPSKVSVWLSDLMFFLKYFTQRINKKIPQNMGPVDFVF